MSKIILPQDEQIIIDIYNKFNGQIYLCGSGSDHYLLNKNNTTIKDLDFITTNNNIIEEKKWFKLDSKFGKCCYIEIWDSKYMVEIFVVDDISESDLYFCKELNVVINSVSYRLKFIDKIIKNNWMTKKQNHFIDLQSQYLAFF